MTIISTDLIQEEFWENIVSQNSGALRIVKQNPHIDFSEAIVKAAIHNYKEDPQSDGSCAEYLYNIIKSTRYQYSLEMRILEQLLLPTEDDWGLYQLFDLALIFAQHGNPHAREHMYSRFSKAILNHNTIIGAEEIIYLDGIEGFLFVTKVEGKKLLENPNHWQDPWLVVYTQDNNPQIDVMQILAKKAQQNEYISYYYKTICKYIIDNNVKSIKIPEVI